MIVFHVRNLVQIQFKYFHREAGKNSVGTHREIFSKTGLSYFRREITQRTPFCEICHKNSKTVGLSILNDTWKLEDMKKKSMN